MSDHRATGLKILTVTNTFPYPPEDGTRIQIYQRIRQLSAANDVSVLCIHDKEVDSAHVAEMEKLCRCHLICAPPLRQSGSLPARAWRFLKSVYQRAPLYETERFSEEAAEWLRREVPAQGFDVVEADASAGMYFSRDLPARQVLILHRVEDSAAWREIRHTKFGMQKLAVFAYWLVDRDYQRRLSRSADLCVTLTEQCADELRKLDRRIPVRACLSNGIDLDYFQYAPPESPPGGVCFVGKMSYTPNVEAVLYFYRTIWPAIRREQPSLRFWIVGSDPAPEVKALSGDPSVEVTGYVSDVRPYLRQAGIAVIPVQMGGGILNKVLEALAMGVPVVARGLALEGLSTVPGRDLLVADDEDGFAAAVAQLCGDAGLRSRLSQNGRRYVETNHRWEAIVARYEEELRALVGDRAGGGQRHVAQ